MNLIKALEAQPLHEIDRFRGGSRVDAIAFSGIPRKHPYDCDKILLFSGPYQQDASVFEFRIQDIVCAEDLPAPISEQGESCVLVKLWIKKGSPGLRYEPFEVAEPLRYPRDFRTQGEHLRHPAS